MINFDKVSANNLYHDFCIVARNMSIAKYEFDYTLKYFAASGELKDIKHIDYVRKIIDCDYFKVYFISDSNYYTWSRGRHNVQYIEALRYERDLDIKMNKLKNSKKLYDF